MTFVAAAVAMYMVEGDVEGSKITSLGDAFWWAVVTVATVPYGDVYPVTAEGRIVASFFMLVGVAILWVLITTLGGNMIESKIRSKQKSETETSPSVQIINKQEPLLPITKVEFDSLVASVNSLRTELRTVVLAFNIKCKNCKHSNPDDSLFCNNCGSQIERLLADSKLEETAKGSSKDKVFRS
jgi:voltage-gated potassium channel